MLRKLFHQQGHLRGVHDLLHLRRGLRAHVLAADGFDQTARHRVALPAEDDGGVGAGT